MYYQKMPNSLKKKVDLTSNLWQESRSKWIKVQLNKLTIE